jgi:three-Cys-motif partner protein
MRRRRTHDDVFTLQGGMVSRCYGSFSTITGNSVAKACQSFYVCSNGVEAKLTQSFGGTHTDYKLKKLDAYLRAYSTALKNQSFKLIYFDAFAGAGDIQVGTDDEDLLSSVDDYRPFIAGSSQRALCLGRAFSQYHFVDVKKKNAKALEALKSEFPDICDRIVVHRGDANEEIRKFCSETNWDNTRAVVFLDPFGNQVDWVTLVAIAATKRIDVWYLFPAGLGVNRQISREGTVHFTHGAALDRILGTSDWREAFIKSETVGDLFEMVRSHNVKTANPVAITDYMIGRMREIFGGGVLGEWVPLGSKNVHMYSLLFAWGNPSPAACKLANNLAKAVLRSPRHGRAK